MKRFEDMTADEKNIFFTAFSAGYSVGSDIGYTCGQDDWDGSADEETIDRDSRISQCIDSVLDRYKEMTDENQIIQVGQIFSDLFRKMKEE